MTRYSGHIGYAIGNDDVHVSLWNTLGYDVGRFWRKYKDPGHSFYTYDTKLGDCYAWKPDTIGTATLGRIHPRLPRWVTPIKFVNFNRTDGASCQTIDMYYTPGELSDFSAWFLRETFREGTFVELATSTLFDTAALRSDHVVMRAIHMGGNNGGVAGIRETYRLRWHDYTHALKLSKPVALNVSRTIVASALAEDVFYRPNVTLLGQRPPYYNMWR